jgi:putative DNA primase/helicase
LNRALVGLRRLQERGHFIQPESAAEMLQMMADIAAPLRKFIRECCEVDPQYSVDRDELHKAYVAWCAANGHEHPMSKTRFPLVLTTACPEVDIRSMGPRGAQFTRCLGIRLVPPPRRNRAKSSADAPAAVLPIRKLPSDAAEHMQPKSGQ